MRTLVSVGKKIQVQYAVFMHSHRTQPVAICSFHPYSVKAACPTAALVCKEPNGMPIVNPFFFSKIALGTSICLTLSNYQLSRFHEYFFSQPLHCLTTLLPQHRRAVSVSQFAFTNGFRAVFSMPTDGVVYYLWSPLLLQQVWLHPLPYWHGLS